MEIELLRSGARRDGRENIDLSGVRRKTAFVIGMNAECDLSGIDRWSQNHARIRQVKRIRVAKPRIVRNVQGDIVAVLDAEVENPEQQRQNKRNIREAAARNAGWDGLLVGAVKNIKRHAIEDCHSNGRVDIRKLQVSVVNSVKCAGAA